MHVLYTETVARAQYGGGVVALVYVFKYHADMACAQWRKAVEECTFVVAEEFGGAAVEYRFLLGIEGREYRFYIGLSFWHNIVVNFFAKIRFFCVSLHMN